MTDLKLPEVTVSTSVLVEAVKNLAMQRGSCRSWVAGTADPTEVTKIYGYFSLEYGFSENKNEAPPPGFYQLTVISSWGDELTIHKLGPEVNERLFQFYFDPNTSYTDNRTGFHRPVPTNIDPLKIILQILQFATWHTEKQIRTAYLQTYGED